MAEGLKIWGAIVFPLDSLLLRGVSLRPGFRPLRGRAWRVYDAVPASKNKVSLQGYLRKVYSISTVYVGCQVVMRCTGAATTVFWSSKICGWRTPRTAPHTSDIPMMTRFSLFFHSHCGKDPIMSENKNGLLIYLETLVLCPKLKKKRNILMSWTN